MGRLVPSLFPVGPGGYLRMNVYLLGTADGLVKVGMTSRPRSRINMHRRAIGPMLAWVHMFPSAPYGTANWTERESIVAFEKMGRRIRRTEWFEGIGKADAIARARQVLAQVRARHGWVDPAKRSVSTDGRVIWLHTHGNNPLPAADAKAAPAVVIAPRLGVAHVA